MSHGFLGKEAKTKKEVEAYMEEHGHPITWAPVHYHGNPEGALHQKDSPDGANRVPPKGGVS